MTPLLPPSAPQILYASYSDSALLFCLYAVGSQGLWVSGSMTLCPNPGSQRPGLFLIGVREGGRSRQASQCPRMLAGPEGSKLPHSASTAILALREADPVPCLLGGTGPQGLVSQGYMHTHAAHSAANSCHAPFDQRHVAQVEGTGCSNIHGPPAADLLGMPEWVARMEVSRVYLLHLTLGDTDLA